MFRWAEDGSRLELPLSVNGGRLAARMRLARFAPGPIEVTVEAGGREVDRWVQPSLGWRVRDVDLGEVRGPLTLTLRGHGVAGDPSVVAVDWVEVRGAESVRPARGLGWRLALYFLGPPLLVLLVVRSAALAAALGAFAALVAAAAVWRDRLGGASACADAAVPARPRRPRAPGSRSGDGRFWPDVGAGRLRAVAVPLLPRGGRPRRLLPSVLLLPRRRHPRPLPAGAPREPVAARGPDAAVAAARGRDPRDRRAEGPDPVRDGVPRVRLAADADPRRHRRPQDGGGDRARRRWCCSCTPWPARPRWRRCGRRWPRSWPRCFPS